jgi:hypothetical protein
VKRIDYYAVQGPWKMPKWVGAAVGGVFAVIAIGSACVIFAMVRPASVAPAAIAAAPGVATPAVTAAPAQPAAPIAAPAAAPAAPTDEAEPVKSAAKHGKSHHAHAKTVVAKRAPSKSVSDSKAHAILAKHDSRANRKSKDDLDRLLGL